MPGRRRDCQPLPAAAGEGYHGGMFQQVGKVMLVFGLALAGLGGLLWLLGRLGWRMGGDVSFGGAKWRVYLPIGTCIVLSILLSLAMWILSRRR
jgi:hypothetical protein